MSLAQQPVTGKVTLVSAGGGSNLYPSGRHVNFNRISGHRDANNTACPGNALYAQLPEIRRLAAGQAVSPGAGLTASVGGKRLIYPDPAELSGRFLMPDGTPAADAPLDIEFRVAGGSYALVGQALTNPDGSWFSSLPATKSGFYRAHYLGDAANPRGYVSAPQGVSVVPKLTVAASALNVVAGSSVVLKGTIGPVKPKLEIQIYRRDGKAYKLLGTQPVRTRDGAYRAVVKIGTARWYRLRVVFRTDRLNPSVRSKPVVIRGVRPIRSGGTSARA